MTPCVPGRHTHQHGMTLVSLMVGTALSLLLAVVMLQLFKTVTRTSLQAQADAAVDTQWTSALLTAGMAVQAAGFGLESAQETRDFAWLGDAKLDGLQLSGTVQTLPAARALDGQAGAAFVWRSKPTFDSATTQCTALFAAPGQGLTLLWSSADCPAQLNSTQWQRAQALGPELRLSLRADWQTCTPMGRTWGTLADTAHVLLQITMVSSGQLAMTDNFCLSNLSP